MADRPARLLLPRSWSACAYLIAVCGLVPFAPGVQASELRQTPIVKGVQRARPSVVNIRGEKTLGASSSQLGAVDAGRRVNGMGTGVVIDPRGYVITNHHVVDGVREIQVTMASGARHTAELVARDPETDLAIIKISPTESLPVIEIGRSADLMPGEPVVAVGNAYGYEHTVTRGIVSALHRAVQVSDAQYYEDLIQTDASINPGNSGGPLLNIDGEMIGINVAVRAGAQGIGFAIPVDKAMAVAAELLAACSVKHGWHGLAVADELEETGSGVVVASVEEESPAGESGLKPGDVITAAGDLDVKRALDFQRAVLELNAGEPIELVVRRGEETFQLSLQLAEAPSRLQPKTSPSWELLGLELKPIPTAEFQKMFQTRYRGGLSVAAVRPQSSAASQGIRRGDVLVGMHIWETISLENVAYILNRPDFAALNPVKFFILRGNDTLYGYLPVAMRTPE